MITIDTNNVVRKNGRKLGFLFRSTGGWFFEHARSNVTMSADTRDDVIERVLDRYQDR